MPVVKPAADLSLRERSSRRRRLSPQAYRVVFDLLYRVQAGKCALNPLHRMTQIDHINGDPSDNRAENLRGLCAPCNLAERNRRSAARIPTDSARVSEREKLDLSRKSTIITTADSVPFSSQESKKNAEVEPVFRSWVVGKLVFNSGGPLLWDWFVLNGAEVFRVMPVTTTRYLEKMASESGPCMLYEDEVDKRKKRFVKLKPEFWQPQNPRLARLQGMTDQQLLVRIRELDEQPETELERIEASMVLTSRRLEQANGVRDLE